jgi:hypothetical protein
MHQAVGAALAAFKNKVVPFFARAREAVTA